MGLAGRAARVLLGAVTACFGTGLVLLVVLAAFQLGKDPEAFAGSPARRAGAAALLMVVVVLFASLVPMGLKRVAAGLQRAAGAGPRASLVGGPLYGTRAARTRLALLAGALALGTIAVAAIGLGKPALLLGGATAVSALVLTRLRIPDAECAFCGAPRAEVKWLIAGDAAAICDSCAVSALAAFSGHFDGRGELDPWISRWVGALPERCPRALSRPFLERMAGAERRAADVRNVLPWCFRLGNEPLARELLEAIPPAERLPHDWINLGVALADERRFEEALQATMAAGDAAEPIRPWVLGNCAFFRAQLSPGASQAELAAWLRDVEDAQRLLLLSGRPHGWEEVLSSLRGVEAELRRRAGDPEGALRVLDGAPGPDRGQGWRLVVRARVLAGLGRREAARQETERALGLLHPEGFDAAEARKLLAAL